MANQGDEINDLEMKTEHVGNLQGLHKLFYGNLIRI